MFGDYNEKFAGDRLFMAYQICHPGKKLMFMGQEYGQFREWDYENQLEWFMLDFDMHSKLRGFVMALNRFYLENRELWDLDFSWDGFEWIYPDMSDLNIIAFRRMDKKGNELVIGVQFLAGDEIRVRDKAADPREIHRGVLDRRRGFRRLGHQKSGRARRRSVRHGRRRGRGRSAGEEETHDRSSGSLRGDTEAGRQNGQKDALTKTKNVT